MHELGLFLPSHSRAQIQAPQGHMATARGSSDEEEEDSQVESDEDSITAIKEGLHQEADKKDVKFNDSGLQYKTQPHWSRNERGETDL